MNLRVLRFHMCEVSGCEHERLLVKDLDGRNGPAGRRETNRFRETCSYQLHRESTAVPHLKRGPAKVYMVDFDSFFKILGDAPTNTSSCWVRPVWARVMWLRHWRRKLAGMAIGSTTRDLRRCSGI